MSGKPLRGVTVLDLTQGVAGPHATMLMAQAGAEVVKIEPLDGDWGRTIGTSYGDLAAHAIAYNRGKRSLAVDLKSDAGREIVQRIAAKADIVAESFRPGVAARLGFGYDALATQRSSLVYLSISGYGQHGPYRDFPVTDSVMQAFSGWMTSNTTRTGEPQRNNMVVIDMMTGLYGFNAVLLAWLDKLQSGEGSHIDCSLMQVAAAFQTPKIIAHHLEGGTPGPLYVPAGTMKTADGYLNFAAMHEEKYRALCRVLGREDLATHPDYDSRVKRVAHAEPLMREIEQAFLAKTTAEWSALLAQEQIQNSAVRTYGDYLVDPHVQAVDGYDWVQHDGAGRLPLPRIPGLRSDLGSLDVSCPHVGQHTRALLSELGISRTEIELLHKDRVVASPAVASNTSA